MAVTRALALLCVLLYAAQADPVTSHGVRMAGSDLLQPSDTNPSYVTVVTDLGRSCNGVIVNAMVVITTAGCLLGAQTATVQGTGSASLKIFIHPDFISNGMVNDIAVIIVSPPLTVGTETGQFKVATLPHPSDVDKDKMAARNIDIRTAQAYVISNMGDEVMLGTRSLTAYRAELDIRPQAECAACLKNDARYKLPNTSFCGVLRSSTQFLCKSDLGAPVFGTVGTKTGVLLGLMSHPVQNCPSDMPPTFTRVGCYTKAIRKVVKQLRSAAPVTLETIGSLVFKG